MGAHPLPAALLFVLAVFALVLFLKPIGVVNRLEPETPPERIWMRCRVTTTYCSEKMTRATLYSTVDRTITLRLLFLFFALALSFLFVPTSFAAAPQPARAENFEPVPCSTFEISSDEFECGYVIVPELYSAPDGKQIKLAVAILPRTGSSDTGDAFVVAQGGPGGSTLDTFASFFQTPLYPALSDIRSQRDIVLYDQRGTLYSQPALMCPEELDLTLQNIEQDIPPEKALRQSTQAALACRERLVKQGVNLAAYNSIENARDIESVRRALGYEALDFYGVSYGTLLGLHGLRETPATFRSMVLDAVVPAQNNPNSEIARSQQRAFDQLFTTCAADEGCNRAYPNLKQTFYALVETLTKMPARIPLTDSKTGKTYNAVINGDDFMNLLFQFIYNTELLPALPQMIYDARDGRYALIQAFYPLVLFDRSFASGMYYSVMCAEDADFTLDELALDRVDAPIAKAQKRDTASFLDLCQKWNVPQLGPEADAPIRSNVPTLVLSGDFDPITPPPFGQAAAETISPSYVFEFPAYGHGAMTSGNCPNALIDAFVRNPERAPDAQCIRDDASRINFLTPSTQLLSPAIGKLQFAMLQGKIDQFILPIVVILFLLSVWIVAPLAWVIRHAQKRRSEPHLAAKLAPWLAAAASAIALFFFLIVFVLVLIVAFQNSATIGLVVGASRSWLVVYLMPLLFTIAALGFTATIVLAWLRRNWGVPRRIYFTALAVAAFVLAVWFWTYGLLFAFLG